MKEQIRQLLKPEILNTVGGLELIARVIVEGFMTGSNRSQTVGAGQEFSQYRSYEPGDDPRQLDWKMFARSERYFVKQAEIETNITVKFIIDASNSMAHSEGGINKLQYAKVMTAALAYLARKQSDTFGLFTVNNTRLHQVHPRFEHQQFMRFLNELIRVSAESTWKRDNGLERLYDHHGKELIVFITDLYDDGDDLYQFINRLKTPRNEVVVFHLLGRQEIDFGHDGAFTFEDLESGEKVKVDSRIHQKQYAGAVAAWLADSRNRLLEKHVSYEMVCLDEPVEKVLHTFLTKRKSLLR